MDRIKTFFAMIGLLVVVGLIAVAVVAVSNISPDSQAMGLGVMLGCAAGLIPLAIIGLVALVVARVSAVARERRMMNTYNGYGPQMPYTPQPPVIVVGGGAGGMMPPYNPYAQQYGNQNWDMVPTANRQFSVIGADGEIEK